MTAASIPARLSKRSTQVAHNGTYALAVRVDEGAHISGYALAALVGGRTSRVCCIGIHAGYGVSGSLHRRGSVYQLAHLGGSGIRFRFLDDAGPLPFDDETIVVTNDEHGARVHSATQSWGPRC